MYMEINKGENIGWIDWLRVLACFLVVFSHSCDSFVAQFDNDRLSFLTGVFAGSLVRPCVPLFAMMTGVLLLPLKPGTSLGAFYSKRIGRLLVPLVFWSLLLPVLFFGYYSTIGHASLNPAVDVGSYTLETLAGRLYTFVLNFNFDTTPLWYLYMLIGLYFVMPLLSAWLVQASKRDVEIFLSLWAVSLLLPYVKMLAPLIGYQGNYGNMEILGGCDWNVYTTFYYLSGFVGYLVLAYYLVTYPLQWSWRRMLFFCLPSFLVGYAVTAWGYIAMQQYFPGNYAYLEILWLFCGVNVFLMTLPVFLVVQKLNWGSGKLLRQTAGYTFGIYLCHFVIVYSLYDFFNLPWLPCWLRIPLTAATAFLLSWLVVHVLWQSKLTRRFVR